MSNLAWRVSQSQNGGTIFALTKWSAMLVVFDEQLCILIIMSIKSSVSHEYNSEKHVLWAQHSFQNPHQIFHDWCPKKKWTSPKEIGPLVHLDMSRKYGTCEQVEDSLNSGAVSDFGVSPNLWPQESNRSFPEIVIKSEVWIITSCLGLGHET